MSDERFRERAREILAHRKHSTHVVDEKLAPERLNQLLTADAHVVRRLKRLSELLAPAEGDGAEEVRDELALLDYALEELDAQFVALVATLAADLACEAHDCLERGKVIETLEAAHGHLRPALEAQGATERP